MDMFDDSDGDCSGEQSIPGSVPNGIRGGKRKHAKNASSGSMFYESNDLDQYVPESGRHLLRYQCR